MKFATVRTFKNQTSRMLRLAAGGKDILITSRGRPIALLQGMTENDIEDYVLSRHPLIRESIEDASRHYRKHGGTPLEEVVRRLERKTGPRHGKLRH